MRNLVLGLGKECDGGSDGGDAAFLDDDGGEVAVVEGLDVHVGLVGLDDDDAVALGELVASGSWPERRGERSFCGGEWWRRGGARRRRKG